MREFFLSFQISIPSGAIKRLSTRKSEINTRLFQFLLVRLKVFIVAFIVFTVISIPSGAIKSST